MMDKLKACPVPTCRGEGHGEAWPDSYITCTDQDCWFYHTETPRSVWQSLLRTSKTMLGSTCEKCSKEGMPQTMCTVCLDCWHALPDPAPAKKVPGGQALKYRPDHGVRTRGTNEQACRECARLREGIKLARVNCLTISKAATAWEKDLYALLYAKEGE